jgi:hypothetical protein
MFHCKMCALLLGTFLSACASALGEEGSYRLRHYDLKITPDFSGKNLSISANVTIQNPGLEKAFAFGLNDRYDSVSVSSPSTPVRVERSEGWITVNVARSSEDLTLSFALSGAIGKSTDEECETISDSSLFLLWSDRFYPIDFDRWASVRTEIILPPDFQAIAPGHLTARRGGTKDTLTFESERPTVSFSVFADRRWVRTERVVNGIRMQTLLYPQSQKFSEEIFRSSGEILKFYSEALSAYPFDQFSFITIEGMYARRAFPGFIGYEPRYLQKEFTTTGHDAHETALLWWGYTTHGSGPGGFQWTEGFGDYSEILYDLAAGKPIPAIFQRFRKEYLALPREMDLLPTELRGNSPQKIIHGKYPWLMHLLRYVAGDSAFRGALHLLFQRFSYRTFSLDQFISTLEEGCGRSLSWWRQEWVERKGVPEIAWKYDIHSNGEGYAITCTIEQRGNLYTLPLEIGIESPEGIKIVKAELRERRMTLNFLSEDRPTRILIDPHRWLLMKVLPLE